MNVPPLSRRRWLGTLARTALATSAAGLAGCARPQPAALSLPTLIVDDLDFVPLTAELTRAWDPRSNGAQLHFGLPKGQRSDADADVLQIPAEVDLKIRRPVNGALPLPLRSYLEDANFDLSTLVPGVTAVWTDLQGDVLALPIQVAEYQFYVNHGRLQALGLDAPRRAWTFADMRTALGVAVAADPQGTSPLVIGAWDDPNFLAAVIVGFGGSVRDSQGRLDLTQAADALRPFIDLVRSVRWPPSLLAPPATDFSTQGFAGSAAAVPFAFAQPWSFQINAARHVALRTMASDPFPAFPARRAIPGFGAVGLAVNQASSLREPALRFLLWVLKPEQQRLLAAHGWAPVILDPGTLGYWQREMDASPDFPRFEPGAYFDFQGLLATPTARASVRLLPLVGPFQRACAQLYQGADVATQLQTMQRAIDAQGAG